MTSVTSNHKGPLALPGGQVIEPGQTVTVKNWSDIKAHHHVKRLIDAKVIVVDGAEPGSDPEPGDVGGYKVAIKSPGWFHVVLNGKPVTKAMRQDDIAPFEAMSDEDKVVFVDANPPTE